MDYPFIENLSELDLADGLYYFGLDMEGVWCILGIYSLCMLGKIAVVASYILGNVLIVAFYILGTILIVAPYILGTVLITNPSFKNRLP